MLDHELLSAARLRLRAWGLTPGDKAIVLADTDTYAPLLEACFLAASEVTPDLCVVTYPTRFEPFADIPDVVERAIAQCTFIVDIPSRAWTYSGSHNRVESWVQQAGIKGGRWGGQEEDIPHFKLLTPDDTVDLRSRRAKDLFDRAHELHLTSSVGTDLYVSRGDPLERPTFAPSGQAAFAPPEESVNGVLVLLGAIRSRMPGPDGPRLLVNEPTRCEFEAGVLVGIDETGAVGRFLSNWFASWRDPLVYHFAHINLGVDHRVRLQYLDNLAVHFNYGGILCGIGTQYTPLFGHSSVRQARAHIELHVTGTSLEVDGVQVTRDGQFTAESGIPGFDVHPTPASAS